jgi:hypothetical protein
MKNPSIGKIRMDQYVMTRTVMVQAKSMKNLEIFDDLDFSNETHKQHAMQAMLTNCITCREFAMQKTAENEFS